jgi:hypothetical protein
MIYTFGDSHCCFPWGAFEGQHYKVKIPNVIVPQDHINGVPQTMYKFGLSQMILVDKIPKDSIACFSFGEIDCRYHIFKYQSWWKENIENVVKEYLNTIRKNAKINQNIWIYNIVHPLKDSEREDLWYGSPDRKIPFRGSDYERLLYAKYMNKLLRENSEFVFVDIMDKYCDKDGFLIKKFSDSGVHITDERYLVEWINRKEFVG